MNVFLTYVHIFLSNVLTEKSINLVLNSGRNHQPQITAMLNFSFKSRMGAVSASVDNIRYRVAQSFIYCLQSAKTYKEQQFAKYSTNVF